MFELRATESLVSLRGLARKFVAAAALVSVCAAVPHARASIVERVVAVVGERPILLSDLRRKARPFLFRIAQSVPDVARQAAAETEMFRDLLSRMVDDRLEEQAADRAHLSVAADEVDSAIRNIAEAGKITIPLLLAEAGKQGLTEQDYRDEIRHQVLEGKLVQLRVRGRVRVTDQDARAAYGRWLRDLGDDAPVEIRILPVRIQPGSDEKAIATRVALAETIVEKVKAGAEFCAMVTEYSDEAEGKPICGSRPAQQARDLPRPIQDAIEPLKEGEISAPIRYGSDAVLIVQLVKQAKIPTFDDVKDSMTQRAFGEAMERQRKLWLQELRQGVYVDVRL